MTISDAIAAELPFLRAEAEALMTLTLTAYAPPAPDAEPTTDADGYSVAPPYTNQGTTPGKAQGTSVTGRDTISRQINVAGVSRPVIEGGLQIPLSAFFTGNTLAVVASEQRGTAWEFEVTALGPNDDPALLGRRYMVTNAPAKSYATARRLDVVEVPAP